MNMVMRLLRPILFVLAFSGLATFSVAQDDAAGDNAAGDAAAEPAPAPDAGRRAPADDDDDVFIPTEEIPADEEITFPVNI